MKKRATALAGLSILLLASSLTLGCATRNAVDTGLDGQRSEVVLAGLSQIGTPYVYGGAAPAKGFDCSGLTHYAHHVAGLSIPRRAIDQRQAAKPVSAVRPRPGDMVFFKTGPSVYHVGLMVDDKRFVHASTSRHRVRLARLDKPYWQARYLGAGTYLN